MDKKLSVLVVVPRYGKSLGGGAETLLKSLVDNIFNVDKEHFKSIEVWTTCANDHRTWENYHEPGVEYVDEIKVTRFPVDKRNLDKFIESEMIMQSGRALLLEEQIEWLKAGVNSVALYEELALKKQQFDLVVLGPYLFPITYWSAMICPEKSILVPCLHDEQYAYLDCFRELFKNVKGVFFNALPEKELAQKIYQLSDLDSKGFEIGMGFDLIESQIKNNKLNYILYSGRKEQGKGLDFLISCYENLPIELRKEKLKLYLIGSGKIEFLEQLPEGVVDLGFVSEEKKLELMSNALALIQPSINESFSIVLMEAWLQKTAVIVRSDCAVTKYHVDKSGGGLWFNDSKTFISCVNTLLEDRSLAETLGLFGKEFVVDYYSWTSVHKRLLSSLRSLG